MLDGALFLFVARFRRPHPSSARFARSVRFVRFVRAANGSSAGSPTFFPKARRAPERPSDTIRPRSGRTRTFFARRLPTSTVPSVVAFVDLGCFRASIPCDRLFLGSIPDGARAAARKKARRDVRSHLASGIGLIRFVGRRLGFGPFLFLKRLLLRHQVGFDRIGTALPPAPEDVHEARKGVAAKEHEDRERGVA